MLEYHDDRLFMKLRPDGLHVGIFDMLFVDGFRRLEANIRVQKHDLFLARCALKVAEVFLALRVAKFNRRFMQFHFITVARIASRLCRFWVAVVRRKRQR